MVETGRVVPEILKILGMVKRLEKKGGRSARREGLTIRHKAHFVDQFGATIVKIGQPVQKIFKKYARRYNLIQTPEYEYS